MPFQTFRSRPTLFFREKGKIQSSLVIKVLAILANPLGFLTSLRFAKIFSSIAAQTTQLDFLKTCGNFITKL